MPLPFFYCEADMARRRQNMGTHDVKIPIDEIMGLYEVYLDDVLRKCAQFAVKRIRENAKKFKLLSLSGTGHYKWWNSSGYLLKRIRRQKSVFNRQQYIAGCTAPHAHLLEYGHVKWLHGKNTGEHVPAAPFIRPAEAALMEELPNIIASVLNGKKVVIGGGD